MKISSEEEQKRSQLKYKEKKRVYKTCVKGMIE